ncbi:Hypothetical predicted protein [Octopus vulgaris]|uniref:Uncharacterized protein n=1 Tax=Octopus vulgaris TaxID=6645 RepID=A0AA36AGX2_OCTVU|nr:Hypothetical predicted protein [Octopus vulgaris]
MNNVSKYLKEKPNFLPILFYSLTYKPIFHGSLSWISYAKCQIAIQDIAFDIKLYIDIDGPYIRNSAQLS